MEKSSAKKKEAQRKILAWLCHLVFGDDLSMPDLNKKFVYFREELKRYPTEIFAEIVRLLKSIPKQMSSDAAKPHNALILLQLLLECVTQCCILDQACLNMLISTVRVFCVWPKPYGMVARNIFKILLLEKRNPGGTMRARLHSERMQITQDSDLHIFGSRGQKLVATQQATTPVMVYIDESNKSAHTLQRMVAKDAASVAPQDQDQRLLLNLVEIGFEVTDSVAELLKALSPEQNSVVRKQMEQVLSACVHIPEKEVSKCAVLRSKRIAAVLKQHVPAIVLLPRRPDSEFKYLPRFPETHYKFRELTVTKPQDKPEGKPYIEGAYLCEQVSELLSAVSAAAKRAMTLLNSRTQHHRRVLYQAKRRKRLASRSSGMRQEEEDKPKAVLNFAIVGNDRTLHRFLCGFVRTFRHMDTMCKHTEMRLFMIPSQETPNDVAAYLSREDPWYRKNVFEPFTKLPTDPAAKKVYEQLLEDYIKSAHYTVPFRIYGCECWTDASEGRCTVKIPFCISAKIGVDTAVERERQRKGNGLTWEAAFRHLRDEDRHQVYTPKLHIMHRQVDGIADVETPRSYTAIGMRNVPHVKDTIPTDLPLTSHLELEMLASNHFKDYTKKKKSKHADEEVLKSVMRKRGEMHIAGSVEVKCINTHERMLVMLDGVIYGPFHHITVSQFKVGPTRRPINLPIRTFIQRD